MKAILGRLGRLPRLGVLVALTLLGTGDTFQLQRLRAATAPVASGTGYRPPVIVETDRVARVRALAGEVDQIYRDHATDRHIPGLTYGVVVDGSLVLSGGMGFADLERRTEATPRSVFRIASMTKSFTAMAVLRLRDAGRLDLDQPVSRHLPELRRLRLLTTDAPAITARHLLTHAAGFPEDNPWGDRQLADTDGELVDLIRGPVRFSNASGVEYEYSNLGFALLGRLVHRAGGRSCQRYIDASILRPLGMGSTYWEPSRVPDGLLARGYQWRDGAWTEEPLLPDGSFAPMGGLLTSIEDFARYMALHLSAWPPRDDPEAGPLCRASLREMQQPARVSGMDSTAKAPDGTPCPMMSAYGYGLNWAADCQRRVRVGHAGGLPGFGSDWRILPDYGFGVVAFGNRTYAGLSRPTARVIDLLLTQGGLRPRALPASDVLRQRAEQLRALLPDWDGAEASDLFAENFFPDTPLEERREVTRELFARTGPIESVSEVEALNQLRGRFKLRGQAGSLAVFFTLTPENPPRIQALEVKEEPAPGVTP